MLLMLQGLPLLLPFHTHMCVFARSVYVVCLLCADACRRSLGGHVCRELADLLLAFAVLLSCGKECATHMPASVCVHGECAGDAVLPCCAHSQIW